MTFHLRDKALQRRAIRVSEIFAEYRSSDGTRHFEEMSVCPLGLSLKTTGGEYYA